MYRIVFLLISSFCLINCQQKKTTFTGLPYYNEPTFTPVFLNDKDVVKNKITHTIGDFEFLNQDSVLVSQKLIENKIHVANFIFTSCGSICPIMTTNMKIVSDSLQSNSDVVLLSYSVTPWVDTPSVLKEYKKNKGIANDNWHFLTGSIAKTYALARKSYYAEEDIGFSRDSTDFLHTEHFILVDKSKRIRGVYNGTLILEMHQLIDHIKMLQTDN